ncbi:hypothetical protein OE88DRAFT_1679525 [Heliocybe sulcata]|uniref:HAUS augmin-like complex subunit 6 N-terminal domain-containing protein n=1 Tax=Heliocybe sulcata TaxID=5364 RepID=A0A5C3N3L7_9AGAM|nr:hypothetical protein OE88DRAFT_1679525 [Heliocybe sulcata]
MDFLALPTPLLLLLHLHLLSYPYANNAEYDENIFNPQTRGIRERAKTMEDICYFLVGKIEGNARSKIFPVYPCLKPTDATAFRASLTKYLETIRHKAISTNSDGSNARSSAKDTKHKPADGDHETKLAWWWRDIMVRKSLLEECSGDKFERVVLALSTHALSKIILKQLPAISAAESGSDASPFLEVQMVHYAELLTSLQSNRREWERSAVALLRQQADLERLRHRLALSDHGAEMKYDKLSTNRLLMLAETRQQDLLTSYWKGADGQHALDNLLDASGVRRSDTSVQDLGGARKIPGATSENKDNPNQLGSRVTPQSLTTAAAHHPVHIRKLATSVFDKPRKLAVQANQSQDRTAASSSHALVSMDGQMDGEKRRQRALQDALARTRRVGNELGQGLQALRERIRVPKQGISGRPFELWTPPSADASIIDFNTPVSSELLASLSLTAVRPSEDLLEARVRHIRERLLPAFPALPIRDDIVESTLRGAGKSSGDFSVEILGHEERSSAAQSLSARPGLSAGKPYSTSIPRKSIVPKFTGVQNVPIKKSTKSSHPKHSPSTTNGKRTLRKSRVSLTLSRGKASGYGGKLAGKVDKIADDIGDTSASIQDDLNNPAYTTPRRRPSPAESLMTRSTVKTKKVVPSRRSPRQGSDEELETPPPEGPVVGSDAEWTDDEERHHLGNSDSDEDLQYEGNSMSLADILLRAEDTSQFDLLDAPRINLADQSMGWD